MEIFNIHIFEFVLIAALALVIFGPERLPEVGRFIGKQVARFLAWQQQSPELKMINEIRSEFEQEIGSLRDELVRTRQQLDVKQNVQQLESELKSALDLKHAPAATAPASDKLTEATTSAPEPSIAPPRPDAAPAVPDVPTPTPDLAAQAGDIVVQAPEISVPVDTIAQAVPTERPNKLANSRPASVLNKTADLPPPPRHRQNLHDSAHLDEPVTPASEAVPEATPPTNEELGRQIAVLSAELAALHGILRARGLLTDEADAPTTNHVAEETLSR